MGFSVPRNKATWKEQKRQTEKRRRRVLDELRRAELARQPWSWWYFDDDAGSAQFFQDASAYNVGSGRVVETTEFKYQTISFVEETPTKVFKEVHTFSPLGAGEPVSMYLLE